MRYIVFLRGINVGGHSIKMADLKACFESIGLKSVKTIQQTGNVLFESSVDARKLKRTIEAALTRSFNYQVRVQVINIDSLREIVAASPFSSQKDSFHQYVLFFEDGLEKELLGEFIDLDSSTEVIKLGNGVIYWSVRVGMTLDSQFAKFLTKAKYKSFNTNRNIRTLQKIIDQSE
ncbi:MAG: DUF1697 domain-containing protein [Candidatus Saccharimonadales bacterium]